MRPLWLAGLLALAACGPADNEPGPGEVTVGEAKALDEAAAMIDARRLPAEAVPSAAQPAPSAAPTASATPTG